MLGKFAILKKNIYLWSFTRMGKRDWSPRRVFFSKKTVKTNVKTA